MHRRAATHGSGIDGRSLLASLFLAVVVVVMLAVPAGAGATVNADPDYWKQTQQRRDTVYRLMYSQSPQTIPPVYDPVREAEELLRQQQRALPPSRSPVRDLWRQIRTITVKQALSSPLRALGSIGLGVGVFELGWKIGEGVNAKFLRIGLPDIGPPGVATNHRLVFWAYGEGQSTSGQVALPNNDPRVAQRPECQYTPPPTDMLVRTGSLGHCWSAAQSSSYYLPEHGLDAAGPVEDYSGQPFGRSSPAPVAPPRTTVEPGVTTELDKPENKTLRDWLNHKLGSPGQEDPTGEDEPNPRITFQMPNCAGLTHDPCAQAIRDTGFDGPVNRVDRTFETADVTKAPDAVLDTDPDAGTRVDADGSVTVEANPPAALMPVVIPSIQPGERYQPYANRLSALKLEPARQDATEITMSYAPDGAMSTDPATGTRTRKGTQVIVTTRPRRQRCDLSDPTDEYMAGTGQDSMSPFTGDPPRYPAGAQATFLTPLNVLKPTTTLRWGTATPEPPPDLWAGFGYRKIAAKHGWSPLDEAATRDVLMTRQPIYIPFRGNDRWQFVGQPYPGRDGRPCVRIVIVDYGLASGKSQPEGIITSYGGDPIS